MDETQLRRQYEQDTSLMVNPPSFETWLKQRRDGIAETIQVSGDVSVQLKRDYGLRSTGGG